jgi:hypothetical protein
MSLCKAMVHINNLDNIVIMDWLVKSMKSVSGTITINAEKEPAIQINARTNRIDIDILRPELFKLFEAVEDDDATSYYCVTTQDLLSTLQPSRKYSVVLC